jgi:hypothetical protein
MKKLNVAEGCKPALPTITSSAVMITAKSEHQRQVARCAIRAAWVAKRVSGQRSVAPSADNHLHATERLRQRRSLSDRRRRLSISSGTGMIVRISRILQKI